MGMSLGRNDWPYSLRTVTDTFPSSAPSAETAGAAFSWLESTLPTANVRFFRSVAAPVPVTTTSSSCITSNCSWKSKVCVPGLNVTCRTSGLYPTERARSVTVCPFVCSAGTVSVYVPAVVVEMAAPTSAIDTVAPLRDSPPFPETLPVMTADWAARSWNAAPDNTSSAPAHTITLNVRGLIIMTPPSVACGPHQAPQRQGLGAQRRG